jgi:hypothetical protein
MAQQTTTADRRSTTAVQPARRPVPRAADRAPGTELVAWSEAILSARHEEATDRFCRMMREGRDLAELLLHAINTTAPYLHVPSHVRVKGGEMSLVNYDHCFLALRGSLRMMRYLPMPWTHLPMAQAIWYFPQGLDVWNQLHGRFPGHYAYSAGYKEFPPDARPAVWFEDREPLLEGTAQERLDGLFQSCVSGDRDRCYRLFLGLAAEPDHREALRAQILFCSIADVQDTVHRRTVRSTGHKALRIRAMLDLADFLGWENAHSVFYAAVPALPVEPLFYVLYNTVSNWCREKFGDAWGTLPENTGTLDETELAELRRVVLQTDSATIFQHLTELLQAGKSVLQVADGITAAAARAISEVENPKAFFMLGHVFDYLNVVNHWLRTHSGPHAPKFPFLQALFLNDVIRLGPYTPRDWKGSPSPCRGGGSGERWRTPEATLAELDAAIEAQEGDRAVALVRSYLDAGAPIEPLKTVLVLGAAKFQNDPHQQRFCSSTIEESEESGIEGAWADHLMALANYGARSAKRSTRLECYELYRRHFVA